MSVNKEILRQIPKQPGVYMYKNTSNEIIYVGKAKNLFNRVHSYFVGKRDPKTQALVKKIAHVEFFVTENETEALILENNLIKQHTPKYNIQLKDSKSYPFIKVSAENLPRIYKCREKITNTGTYFGPFVNAELVDNIIIILNKTLKLRKCRKKFRRPFHHTPCLNYHMGLCCAPCAGLISEEEYLAKISSAKNFLSGNTKPLIALLTEEMQAHSTALQFEKAAAIRDQIKDIELIKPDQFMQSSTHDNADYIGFFVEYDTATVSIIMVRDGKVIDKKNFLFGNILENQNFEEDFIRLYYLNQLFLPDKIFTKEEIENSQIIIEAIEKKTGKKLKAVRPETLRDKRLTKLAIDNAGIHYEEKKLKLEKIHHLRELKKILMLEKMPRHIECFDVATLNGKFNTAAMSVFIDGEPDRTRYRQFNVEGEGHPDDYAMMSEVIARRYQRLQIEGKEFPDLIVVDGGKGQLSAAAEVLDALHYEIPIIGIAKKEEEIFIRGRKAPIKLPERSYALKIIQAIRDESHRFSNTRLAVRYKNDTLKSELLKIEGVGDKMALRLIKAFGSTRKIKNASVDSLVNAAQIGVRLAEKIYHYFH